MVASNTYRNPAMLTKIITTIDHISGGRAILGVGAGWAEHEHDGLRLRVRGQRRRAAALARRRRCRSCAACSTAPSPARAARTTPIKEAYNEPPPLQERMPILIGGSGREVTLRLVAEYADMCNIGGSPANVLDADAALIASLRGQSGATRRRSSAPSTWAYPRSATRARQAFRDRDAIFEAQESSPGRTSPLVRPRMSSSGSLATSRSATATSSSTGRRPTTTRRWSAWPPRCGPGSRPWSADTPRKDPPCLT